MALLPEALLIDQNQVWDILDANLPQRSEFSDHMERWINSGTLLLEQLTNRKLRARTLVDAREDGSGTWQLIIEKTPYPIISITRLEIFDRDLAGSDVISVVPADRELTFDADRGLLWLLPDAPLGRFTRGINNIAIDARVGFEDDGNLAPFQDALIEMIQIRWKAIGAHPMEQTRSDSIGTSVSFTLIDFKRLPVQVQQSVMVYRSIGV